MEDEEKISRNKVFRSYISNKEFRFPEDFPNVKSLIIIAVFMKPMLVNFRLGGRKHEIVLPLAYYDDGLTVEMLRDYILKEVVNEPGHRIERAKVLLKLLAVRSGLGKYGRNNLCFVERNGKYARSIRFLHRLPVRGKLDRSQHDGKLQELQTLYQQLPKQMHIRTEFRD